MRIQCPQPLFLPTLPDGYGVKGGAARLALRWILEGTAPTATPRDIDLVRIKGEQPLWIGSWLTGICLRMQLWLRE